jgi:Rrf2 family protein
MRLSKRGEYGLRSMIRMAEFYRQDGEPNLMQIKEISKIENISVKYLEQILLALKNAGLLNSRVGVNGGYYLARPPDEIMLGQIVRTLDGPLAPIRCVSQMAYEQCDCPEERTCGVRMVMGDVRNAIANILDNTSLEDVRSRVAAVQESGLEVRIRKNNKK